MQQIEFGADIQKPKKLSKKKLEKRICAGCNYYYPLEKTVKSGGESIFVSCLQGETPSPNGCIYKT